MRSEEASRLGQGKRARRPRGGADTRSVQEFTPKGWVDRPKAE